MTLCGLNEVLLPKGILTSFIDVGSISVVVAVVAVAVAVAFPTKLCCKASLMENTFDLHDVCGFQKLLARACAIACKSPVMLSLKLAKLRICSCLSSVVCNPYEICLFQMASVML